MMNIMQTIPTNESVKDQSLAGKVVLVTGGASGLGAALCRVLTDAGAEVAICDIHPDKAEAHARTLTDAGGRVHSACFDVGDPAAARKGVEDIVAKFGRIDVLINNAGTDMTLPISELTTDQWLRVINTNLNGPFFLAKYAAEHMKKAG